MEGRRLPGKLPGEELVRQGIGDYDDGVESPAPLLVSIGAPRLCRLGFALPQAFALLERRSSAPITAIAVHSRYNAFVRRLVSFDRTSGTARRLARTAMTRTCAQRIRH